MSYEYYNTIDNSTPFRKYSFTKSRVNPVLLRWLQKEGSLFDKSQHNYHIQSIIPISELYGRYRWGTWTANDGSFIKNAYAQKQNFIVTYTDQSTRKCYASNFTATCLEANLVLVSSQDIKLSHTRIISCK